MKVLTFGELLLRLSTPGFSKIGQKDIFEATYCGAEANVAVSLANYGVEVAFLTKLPKNEVGVASANALRYFGVDVSKIIYGDGRLGLYYLEKGASQRPSKVIYDRESSAISLAKKEEFDWDSIFEGISWFHFAGITPALSKELQIICEEACKVAKRKGIIISCDLNYRAKLWSEEEAQLVMKKLVSYADVCIGNEEDAEKCLGIQNRSNVNKGQLNKDDYINIASEICDKFGCKYVAITLRESINATINNWSAMLYANKQAYFSSKYEVYLVDRLGGGDSFAAGLIYCLLNKKDYQCSIEFAAACSCLKQTIEGDFNRVTVSEVQSLLDNGGSGRIKR